MDSLEEEIEKGTKQLLGNSGHRRVMRVEKNSVSIYSKNFGRNARYYRIILVSNNVVL